MKKLFLFWILAAALLSGCARNYYNVPTENFSEKVKTLGVAPIILDTESDIRHPQKDLLIQMVVDLNRRYEQQLTRKLKATGNFYSVTLLDSDPSQLLTNMLFRREKRDDAAIQYNKYFWKTDELRNYLQKNNLDAVMLVTISGLTRRDKIYSSDLFNYLDTNYNYLTLTAQILDANGTILWEYPNFRRRILSYSPLINLQYPDFSESDANLSKKTEVKFKTLDGIRRALEKRKKDWLLRETSEPETYGAQFDEIVSMIKYDNSENSRSSSETAEPPKQFPATDTRPAPAPPAAKPSAPPAQPAATTPSAPVPAVNASESRKPGLTQPEAQIIKSDEIVPASESTR